MPGEDIILRSGVDNSAVQSGLNQFEAMVDAKVKAIQAKLGTAFQAQSKTNFGALGSGLVSNELTQLESQFKKTSTAASRFGTSIDRIAGTLNTGLGIGLALGGLASLEKGFERAITKAREFEVAQLAIAASLQSNYKITGSGGQELVGSQGFQASLEQGRKLNAEIIKRQAGNILTYQEQLGAFQSSVSGGSKKGLSPTQILDVSERLAVVAKTIGLRGEQIANAARLGLGGGSSNVSRSAIGRTLGITNDDINKLSGQKFVDFIKTKTKGFEAGQATFGQSIEGVLSTLEARLDVFLSKVGQKLFAKIKPAIEELGKSLEGGGADKFADILVNLFNGIFKALSAIANSPAIPLISKFLEFLGSYGDKLLIVGALSKFSGILAGLIGNVKNFTGGLVAMAEKAMIAAGMVDHTTSSVESFNAAAGVGASRGLRGAGGGALAGATSTAGLAAEEGLLIGTPLFGHGRGTNYAKDIEAKKLANNKAMAERLAGKNDESFKAFTEQAAFTPRIEGDDLAAEANKAEKAAIAEAKLSRTAKFKGMMAKLGYIGANGLQNAALFGGLGFLGGQFAQGEIGGKEGSLQAGFGDALAAGLPAAGGLYGLLQGATAKGLPLGPIGAAGGVGLGIGTAYQNQTNGVDFRKEAASESSLENFNSEHPLAKQIEDLKGSMARIRGNDKLTPEYQSARLKEITKQIQDLREAGSAKFESDTTQKDLDNQVKYLQAGIKGQQLGYGFANRESLQTQQSALSDAEIRQMAGKNDLLIDSDVKGRAGSAFAQAQHNRDIFRQIAPGQPLSKEISVDGTLEETQQRLQADKLLEENRLKLSDQRKIAALNSRGALAGLNSDKITGGLEKGLADTESGLRQNRDKFDLTPAAFEKLIQTAKQKFIEDFDAPLKRVEGQIQAINLGGAPQNLGRLTQLTISAAEKKLDELGRSIGLSKSDIDKLKIEARNKALSELTATRFGERATLAGGRGDAFASARLAKQGELESQRLKLEPDTIKEMGYANYEAYRKASLDTFDKQQKLERINGGGKSLDVQIAEAIRNKGREITNLQDERYYGRAERDLTLRQQPLDDENFERAGQKLGRERSRLIEEHPLNLQDAQLGVQSAAISARRAQLAPTLNVGGPFSDAASAIRYKVDSEKGFNANKFESAYRESKQLDVEEAELAKKSTEIAKQRAGINLARVELDYKSAMEEVTAQLKQRDLDKQRVGLERDKSTGAFGRSQDEIQQKLDDAKAALASAGISIPGITGPVGGAIPGVSVPVSGANGGVTVPSSGQSSGTAAGGDGIVINVGDVNVAGVSKEDLAKMLSTQVPALISEFCRTQARKSK